MDSMEQIYLSHAPAPPGLNMSRIAPALYARSTSAKLVVGSATPSLRRRTPDADIRHYA